MRIALLLLLALSTLDAEKKPWSTGKIIDSQSEANRSLKNDKTLVMIQGDQFLYTVSDDKVKGNGSLIGAAVAHAANSGHGCRFIVNDQVQYLQEKDKIQVIDADGKTCKMRVIRQERLEPKPAEQKQ
jgi:hypothetical protein